MPITWKSNEYWGHRSGYIHPTRGPMFPGKRGSVSRHEHSAPCGYKLKRLKTYRNAKLRRKGLH